MYGVHTYPMHAMPISPYSYKLNIHIMQQNPPEFPQVYGVSQQVSTRIQHPVPSAYQTEFNSSSITTTGLCLTPHLASSGSVPSTASSPFIHQPSLNPSLAGPSTLPSQGVLEKSPPFPYNTSIIPKICVQKMDTFKFMTWMLTWYAHVQWNL